MAFRQVTEVAAAFGLGVTLLIGATAPSHAAPTAGAPCELPGSVQVANGLAYTCQQGVNGTSWSEGLAFGIGRPCVNPGSTTLVEGVRYRCDDAKSWQKADSQPAPAPPPPDAGDKGASSGTSSAVGIPADSSFRPARFSQDKAWRLGPVILDSRNIGFLFADAEAVRLADGRTRLYVPTGDMGAADITSFISQDGLRFTQEPGVRLQRAGFPSVLRLKDGTWRMYYTSQDAIGEVRSAVSKDGLSWSTEAGVRAAGQEPSAVLLKDGRILLSVRRTLEGQSSSGFSCNKSPSVIDFYTSRDGVAFTKVREAVNGTTYPGLDGRAIGNELTRMKNGQLGMFFEGCYPMFWAPVNEKTLQLGKPKLENLRGSAIASHYGDAEIGGAGGDATHVVAGNVDRVYVAVRSPDGRERLVTASRR